MDGLQYLHGCPTHLMLVNIPKGGGANSIMERKTYYKLIKILTGEAYDVSGPWRFTHRNICCKIRKHKQLK